MQLTFFVYPLLKPLKFKSCLGKASSISFKFLSLLVLSLLLMSSPGFSQSEDQLLSSVHLKKMSMEELMNLEVISVSKQPEKLTEVASAIQVITQEDIRRSGATNIPEALRLASNLQVAQANSSQWAISSRGFNNVISNKLLVMIDGRTVYTPLYAGVFWDVQNVVLEDIERIEVISGPGGTMWGSNAVNGVINIITKSAENTQGLFVEAAAGSHLNALGSVRYGGKIAKDVSYRAYATGYSRDNTYLNDGADANDEWKMGQAGFRMDWDASSADALTLQGDYYKGKPNPDGLEPVINKGGNVLARWSHTISDRSDFQLQFYYDQTWRDFSNGLTENLKTYDLDWQHKFSLGERHEVIWGLGARLMDHKMQNLELFAFLPGHKLLQLYSGFVQDEISLIKERLHLTIGSKFEHNSYTGMEYQPNARLAWMPKENHTIWGGVSRAVRIPARIDADFFLFIAPEVPFIAGSDFESEELLSYEIGWRLQPSEEVTISLATFYNFYDNLRTAEPGQPLPITFGNGLKGETYGIELSSTYQPTEWWRLRGGYTFLKKDLTLKPGSADTNQGTAESNDPEHQLLLQSSVDLPGRLEFNTFIRYIGELQTVYVSDYVGLDINIGWKINSNFEINLVGQNLIDERHTEFIPESPSARKIPRSIYGKVTCRF